jgi:Chlamydia polymorphic membrane protein (Chlamydia_PMP) repeat
MKTLNLRKSIRRHIIRLPSLAAIIALLFTVMGSVQTLHAATITVMNTSDSGAGSLRQALADANNDDTIDATGISGTITLTSGEVLVDKSVTINGPGATNLAVDGNGVSRVFYIGSGRTVTIDGLTMTNGNGGSWSSGGGIYNDHATLTISNSTLSGNSATSGHGGGIYNDHATLTITNSTLSGNSADFSGGGIYNDGSSGSAMLTFTNSTLSGNSAAFGSGGGICTDGELGSTTLTITNSTVSGNSAHSGGGIVNHCSSGSATLMITNSTVSGNSARSGGGGIYNHGYPGSATLTITKSTVSGNSADLGGGGIVNLGYGGSATLTISNSTLSGNSVAGVGTGGGIYNYAAPLTITNSTLSGNSAAFGYGGGIYNEGVSGSATLTISNTILNAGASGENIYNSSGTVTSHGYNLSSDDASAFLNQSGDQNSTDPMLGPLQDNGGPTFTHELLSGSPAIDAGDPNFTPSPDYDQRGPDFDRVVNGRIDIGAFEVEPPPYGAQVQQPINPDGSSVFNVKRGVVPVKFTLTLGGVATCDLPPATIAVTRTTGGTTGQIDESVYSAAADTGSNFRIDTCQYVYNLSASALGVGTYRVDILIDGQVVGSTTFQLK